MPCHPRASDHVICYSLLLTPGPAPLIFRRCATTRGTRSLSLHTSVWTARIRGATLRGLWRRAAATEEAQPGGAVKRQHLFEPAQRVSLLA